VKSSRYSESKRTAAFAKIRAKSRAGESGMLAGGDGGDEARSRESTKANGSEERISLRRFEKQNSLAPVRRLGIPCAFFANGTLVVGNQGCL
jgi:hypothetical protein